MNDQMPDSTLAPRSMNWKLALGSLAAAGFALIGLLGGFLF